MNQQVAACGSFIYRAIQPNQISLPPRQNPIDILNSFCRVLDISISRITCSRRRDASRSVHTFGNPFCPLYNRE